MNREMICVPRELFEDLAFPAEYEIEGECRLLCVEDHEALRDWWLREQPGA